MASYSNTMYHDTMHDSAMHDSAMQDSAMQDSAMQDSAMFHGLSYLMHNVFFSISSTAHTHPPYMGSSDSVGLSRHQI